MVIVDRVTCNFEKKLQFFGSKQDLLLWLSLLNERRNFELTVKIFHGVTCVTSEVVSRTEMNRATEESCATILLQWVPLLIGKYPRADVYFDWTNISKIHSLEIFFFSDEL